MVLRSQSACCMHQRHAQLSRAARSPILCHYAAPFYWFNLWVQCCALPLVEFRYHGVGQWVWKTLDVKLRNPVTKCSQEDVGDVSALAGVSKHSAVNAKDSEKLQSGVLHWTVDIVSSGSVSEKTWHDWIWFTGVALLKRSHVFVFLFLTRGGVVLCEMDSLSSTAWNVPPLFLTAHSY